MNGRDFIEGIRRSLVRITSDRRTSDRMVADYLGMTSVGLRNWMARRNVTERQMVGLVKKARDVAVRNAEVGAIRTIVEFFPIAAEPRGGRQKLDVFSVEENGTEHPYRSGLREELEAHHGVYIFHDSRGRALYTGKAKRLTLWQEINNAFNRDRSVQQIWRVNHPERRLRFRTSDEKRRQIQRQTVPLYDLAHYFSAYDVADGLIDSLESLLIRSFPNDLLNIRMEKLAAPD